MFDPSLPAEATKLAETPSTHTQDGERAAISTSVAASLRLEGTGSIAESVPEAADLIGFPC